MREGAIFLDRDGIINHLVYYPDTNEYESPRVPEHLEFLPDVVMNLKILQENNWRLFLVSNQPSFAKGKTSLENLLAVHEKMAGFLEENQIFFQDFYYAFGHPKGIVPEYTGFFDDRKPAPGMLLKAQQQYGVELYKSWLVGDSDTDIQCGQSVGCQTILVNYEYSSSKRLNSKPTFQCKTLHSAVDIILEETKNEY